MKSLYIVNIITNTIQTNLQITITTIEFSYKVDLMSGSFIFMY